MAKSAGKREPKRRERAKDIVDFATGEVHDRLIDAAQNPDGVEIDHLSNEQRASLGVDQPDRSRRARVVNQKSRRRWVKARKIP